MFYFFSPIRKALYASIESVVVEAEKAFKEEKKRLRAEMKEQVKNLLAKFKTDVEAASQRAVKSIVQKLIQ